MPTREEAVAFVKDSRRPRSAPEITDRAEKFRRLGLESDERSIAETLRVVALLAEALEALPPDAPFPVRES